MWNKILSLFKKKEIKLPIVIEKTGPEATATVQQLVTENFITIQMPELSSSAKYYKVTKWLVKNNQTIKEGDILAEIETDKVTMEFESFNPGRIEIIAEEGTLTNVGDVIAKIHPE